MSFEQLKINMSEGFSKNQLVHNQVSNEGCLTI